MKKIFFLLSIFAIVLSCSSDETSTPVTPPSAPIAKYTITLSAGEGGTVSTTGGEYESGQTVSVTATPQGEYVFKNWSDGNTDATRTITVSSNSSLTANFEKRKYPLTINFEGEGEVLEEIVSTGRTTDYDSGTTVKLTAQAAAEWVFVGWTGDIESTEESVQIVIGEPKEVTATFEKKKYPLTVNIEGEGEVLEEIIEAGRTTDYNSGTTVKLTAQPEGEWLFTGWSGDIGDIDPTENPIQLNIIESKTVTATFEKKKYPLTVNIEGEGEVLEEIVNAGRTTDYNSGTTVKLTAQPEDEWLFTGWSGDIGDIDTTENPIQLSIIESKTVTATFEKKKYPLTVNIEGEGEVLEEIVNAGRTTDYNSGTTVKLTAQPEDEWLFTGWSGDIGDIDPTENPIQLNIIESKTVTATFEKKKYPLTVNIEGEGEVLEEIVNAGRTTDYNSGTTVKLTAQPEDEWLFTGWSGDIGEVDPTENPIQLSIIESKTVTATFEKKKYPLTVNIEGEGEVLEEIVNAGRTTDYNSGTTVKLTAQPEDEWLFTGWSGDIGDIDTTENPIQLSIIESKTVTATFQLPEIIFSNKSPLYPTINNSIGNIKTNFYHPGLILTPDIIENYIDLRENCDCTGCNCSTNFNLYNNHSRFIDFNNDGRIDLFGWLMNNSGGYGVGFGKYVVVNDVLNNPTTTYYDSNIWFGGRMEVNDFNGDGKDDILVYNQNDHGDNQGGNFTERTPLEIIYFNMDGSFNMVQIGGPTGTHELTSFDIDLDGDVDIVNFEYYMGPDGTEYNNSVQVPLFYINDGSGNFEIVNNKFLEYEYYINTIGIDYNFIAVDSFDLDNDGYIDIIVGNVTDKEENYCVYDNPNDPFEQNCYISNSTEGIRVLWGNGSGTFSEENMTVFESSYFSTGSSKGPLGFNFIDVNNDGNYEVVSTGFHNNVGDYGPYSGGFIDIYSNDGNRGFSRTTGNIMDNFEWFYENKRYVQTGDIPLFYDIGVVDVDSDGDFDLIPHTINTGSVNLVDSNNGVDTFKYQTNIGKNFFWRNDGGFFTLVEDRINYQN